MAEAESQFEITGQKQQISQVESETFMDQSVELTPENIMSTLKQMFDDFKSNTDMKNFADKWNKKAILAWIAVDTLLKTPQPAFAALQ